MSLQEKHHQKLIPYQAYLDLYQELDKLVSWHVNLQSLDVFFAHRPYANKQKLVRDFYANSLIFKTFYQDFGHVLGDAQTKLEEIKQGKGVPPFELAK